MANMLRLVVAVHYPPIVTMTLMFLAKLENRLRMSLLTPLVEGIATTICRLI